MPYPGFDKSKRSTQSEPLAPPPREVVDTVGKTETFWSRNVKLVTFICCMAVIIAGMVAFGIFLHGETKQPDNLMTEEQMQALVEKGSLLTVKDFEPYPRSVMMEDVVSIYRYDVKGDNYYFIVTVEGRSLVSVYLTDLRTFEETVVVDNQ
ncbi:MAG: hypothetical protein E7625_07190 [Ruminococcaceae bacterium]|nr:hypothetical protein [Oscillospiraceae bacterium]